MIKSLWVTLIVVVAVLGICADAMAQSPIWTSDGPFAGASVTAVAINPTTPTTLYVGTSSTGVFQSLNGGANWSATGLSGDALSVSALAINPTTPTTLYAGVYSSGVYESTNGGTSWSAVNTGLPAGTWVSALAINPTTPTTLYAGTFGTGVFQSLNGGGSWSAVNTGLPAGTWVSALAINPTTPTTLYAGTDSSGVFQSTNGGGSWSAVNTGLSGNALNVTGLVINPTTPTTLYVGTSGTGVFQSLNGGGSWSAVNTGLSGNALNILALAINPTTPTTLYAGTNGSEVFQSLNGGGSWSAVNTGLPAGTGVSALAINPTTPTTLYAGTDSSGVFQSTNGGGSWSAVNTGLSGNALNVTALAINPTTPTTLYAGTDGLGVYESTDGGTSWSAVNTGLSEGALTVSALAINPTTPTTLYAGVYGSGVYESTNGGGSWSAVNRGLMSGNALNILALAINPTTPATLYAGTNGGGVYEGPYWFAANLGLGYLGVIALAINPATPTTVYAGTDGFVFQSTNGGDSWFPLDTSLSNYTVTALAINPTTPTTLYAGTNGSGVYESTNGGGSWSAVNGGLSGNALNITALAINPTTPTTLYAGTNGSGVYESTDGGTSWSAVNTGLSWNALNINALAINPTTPTALYAGTGNGVFDTRRQVGSACAVNSDCPSGNCVDGVCCDSSCTGTCQSCAAAITGQPNGTCAPVGVGLQTSNSCNSPSLACNGSTGVGSCTMLFAQGQACSSGSECVTGNCVDGICCGPTCSNTCQSCAAAKTGLVNGTCGSVIAGQQSSNSCNATGVQCYGGYGPGSCAGPCPANAAGAPACVCDTGYAGTPTWNGSSWTGTCSVVACPANAGGFPNCACNSGYTGPVSWNSSSGSWTGTCLANCAKSPSNPLNGTYASCPNTVSGGTCALTCDSGYIKSGNALCTGGSWSAPICSAAGCPANASGAPNCACNDGYTGTPQWNGSGWSGTCALKPGRPCTSGAECPTGFCVDGVCCNSACGGGATNDCQACSVAAGGAVDGTCTLAVSGTICRPAAAVCDIAATCDGSSPTCPSNAFVAPGAQPAGCDGTRACNGVGTCALASEQPCSTNAQCASNSCVGNVCSLANGATCTTGTDCGSGFCVDGVCCNSACGAFSDSCPQTTCASGICQPQDCPPHDTVVLPVAPVAITIPFGKTSVTKTLRVPVRNADASETAGHPVSLSVDDSDCGGNVAAQPNFNPRTLPPASTTVVLGGKTKTATVLLTVSSAAFTGYPKAPQRCTLVFTATAEVSPSYDPQPSNNVVPVELNVINKNDVLTATHETTLGSLKRAAVTINAGSSFASKNVKLVVGNADANESSADSVSVTAADGTCPAGTVGSVNPPSVTVQGGATKATTLPLQLQSFPISTPNELSPYRCVATVSATGPAGDTVGSNNTAQLVIDVLNENDY
jgi:photosystem II stability/assembly factor-like uncharacterized protein